MSALTAAALAFTLAVQDAGASHLVVVTGLGGEPGYRQALAQWAATLTGAARTLGVPAGNVIYLAGDPGSAGARRATREQIGVALGEVAARSRPHDVVMLFLAGHGSHEGAESRLNLPGPDLSAAELGRLLAPLAGRRVIVVNTSSASGDFIAALSAPGRAIITATKTSLERNATQFGAHFAAAYAGGAADADKDSRISLLEAFLHAKRETARVYTSDNRLLTEHAMLDDDGDQTGSAAPGAEGADGGFARTLFLGSEPVTAIATDTQSATLVARKREIEGKISALRARKASLRSDEYEAQLETLLVELALTNEAMRTRSSPQ